MELKSPDASIRHVGPTAQEFRAAFGLGEDDRTINTLDPDGIALRALQALDIRTRQLNNENATLRAELAGCDKSWSADCSARGLTRGGWVRNERTKN